MDAFRRCWWAGVSRSKSRNWPNGAATGFSRRNASVGVGARPGRRDPGPAARGIPDGDRAAVRPDQPVDQVEPEPGPAALTRGPELREHAEAGVRRDPVSGVVDVDHDHLVLDGRG